MLESDSTLSIRLDTPPGSNFTIRFWKLSCTETRVQAYTIALCEIYAFVYCVYCSVYYTLSPRFPILRALSFHWRVDGDLSKKKNEIRLQSSVELHAAQAKLSSNQEFLQWERFSILFYHSVIGSRHRSECSHSMMNNNDDGHFLREWPNQHQKEKINLLSAAVVSIV